MMNSSEKCRIDKWLWAARFFKTRSLASDAVESGKVYVDEVRVKPSKEVKIGQLILIRKKEMTIEVMVKALSTVRRAASDAAMLYQETEESIQKREQVQITRAFDHAQRDRGSGRPTKRQRRDIKKFTGNYF
jgi:ribosome-associated heat shock protein Hsp15